MKVLSQAELNEVIGGSSCSSCEASGANAAKELKEAVKEFWDWLVN